MKVKRESEVVQSEIEAIWSAKPNIFTIWLVNMLI